MEDTGLASQEKALMEELQKRQDRVDEIERRREVARLHATERSSGTVIAPSGAVARTTAHFETRHNYAFAVVCKAHRKLHPSSTRPALRVLGFFHDENGVFDNWKEELRDANVVVHDPESGAPVSRLGDLHKVPVLKYMLIPKTAERDRSLDYVTSKIDAVKAAHMEAHEYAQREFREHVARRATPEQQTTPEQTTPEQRAPAKKKTTSTRATALRKTDEDALQDRTKREVSRVPRSLELRDQNFAVIVSLPDITKDVLKGRDDPEPVVMLLDAFATCEEAEAYVQSLENVVFSVHLDVVEMYAWLFPEDVDYDQVREKYRNPEQDKIMQEKKNQKTELLAAEAAAKRAGNPISAIEVTEESRAPENFRPLHTSSAEFSCVESDLPLNREALEREALEREADLDHRKELPGSAQALGLTDRKSVV